MITIVSDIKEGIEARIEATLPSYNKLSYQIEIEKNKFKGNTQGYSVMASNANETEGLLGVLTLDQNFKVTFTDSYNQGGKSQISDELKASKVNTINNDILTAYRDIILNKGIVDSSILIINGLSIEEAEFSENEKVISITFNFNIKYKINT